MSQGALAKTLPLLGRPAPVSPDFVVHGVRCQIEPSGPRDGALIDADSRKQVWIAQHLENARVPPENQPRYVGFPFGAVHETDPQTMTAKHPDADNGPRRSMCYNSGGIFFGVCFLAHISQFSSSSL